jgi:hypothetical protein
MCSRISRSPAAPGLRDRLARSGNEKLQRVFSLETAGYVCRDLDARIEANQTARLEISK